MSDFVWLEYPDTGGKAQFPTGSAKAWRAKGWVDCDPPASAEPQLYDAPPPALEPAAESEPEPSKSAGRKRAAASPTTAPEE